ncbi:hypothetical protein H4Q26_012065 [Puccinia striiformis f. sp. tritici PST-130]|nr:hypothetical protein H4Q26_012065 [Puccinia striiformis f. sp. tritici PST-130]
MSSSDPYFDVRAEVECSLHSAAGLHGSYKRIISTLPIGHRTESEELISTKKELIQTLKTLICDIEELDHVVRLLEDQYHHHHHSLNRSISNNIKLKFAVSEDEVKNRRRWLNEVQQQVKKGFQIDCHLSLSLPVVDLQGNERNGRDAIGIDLPSPPTYIPTRPTSFNRTNSRNLNHQNRNRNYSDRAFGDDLEHQGHESNQTEEFYHQQESMMLSKQDQTLGTISGVVEVLREQAHLMGQEISEQNLVLDDVDGMVDRTESKLSKANRKLNQFVDQNKNDKSSWTILILIIILTILLLAIILT